MTDTSGRRLTIYIPNPLLCQGQFLFLATSDSNFKLVTSLNFTSTCLAHARHRQSARHAILAFLNASLPCSWLSPRPRTSPNAIPRTAVPKAKRPETGLARPQPIDASNTPRFEDAMLRASQPRHPPGDGSCSRLPQGRPNHWTTAIDRSRYALAAELPVTPRRSVGPQIAAC